MPKAGSGISLVGSTVAAARISRYGYYQPGEYTVQVTQDAPKQQKTIVIEDHTGGITSKREWRDYYCQPGRAGCNKDQQRSNSLEAFVSAVHQESNVQSRYQRAEII